MLKEFQLWCNKKHAENNNEGEDNFSHIILLILIFLFWVKDFDWSDS